jgi:hypothetical protein
MSNNTDRVLYRNSITILSNEPVLLHDIFDENFGSYFADVDFKWIGDVGLDNENVEVTEFTDEMRTHWTEAYACSADDVVEIPKVLYRSTFSFVGNDYVNTFEMLDDHIYSYVASDDFKWIGCPETNDLDNVEVSFDYLKNTKYDNGETLLEVWNEMHGDEESSEE